MYSSRIYYSQSFLTRIYAAQGFNESLFTDLHHMHVLANSVYEIHLKIVHTYDPLTDSW